MGANRMSSGANRQATVRSDPENEAWSGLLSRGLTVLRLDHIGAQAVRFAITGVVVATVYIAVTTFLSQASHIQFQIALAIGWCIGMSVHFTLQRTFVWAREGRFALPFGRQVRRYLLVAGSQLGLTAASTAMLPSVLGLPVEAVYLATAAALTSLNFVAFRHGVFHAEEPTLSGLVGA
jgi:putative flippase GtrA